MEKNKSRPYRSCGSRLADDGHHERITIMVESSYRKLAEKIDQTMHGAPKADGDFSPNFMEYLRILFTPDEAALASCVSIEPAIVTGEQVAEQAGRPVAEVIPILDRMAERNLIIGFGGQYVVPFQYMPMLLNMASYWDKGPEETGRADTLYQEYFIREGFHHNYTVSAAGTPFRRAVPVNQAIAAEQQVLSHEEIIEFVKNASNGALALLPCPCRLRTERLGLRECRDKHPIGACLVVGAMAVGVAAMGWGKQISREEAERHIDEMREAGLVTMTDNAKEMKDGIICFCCGCCCSTTRGITRWDNPKSFARSNFVARVNDDCAACETCIDRCAFDAISLPAGADKAQIDEDRCMGCGACTVTCPTEAIRLERVEREPIYDSSDELIMKVASENDAGGWRRPSD